MIRNSILAACVLTSLVAQSQAATLQLQGTASVDQGSGFGPASSYMLLNGGDRVRALKGCAKILYDNGYSAKVCDGQMAVVFSDPPEYVASGSLKDSPAVVTAPDALNSDLLPAGLLAATGIGAAVAIGTAGGSDANGSGRTVGSGANGGGSTVGGGNRAASP